MEKLEISVINQKETKDMMLNQLMIKSTLKDRVLNSLSQDEKFQAIIQKVQAGQLENFVIDREGLLKYKGRICIPSVGSLREEILQEAHLSTYEIHPGSTKMYQELRSLFWWPGLRKVLQNL
ncbi:hypothetical protein KFK09_014713 [Dendrobium nobile]|uniref:Integrase zinc-binding domain-containing protein n=1 Tax=Dendrobium nobile TaxID=94219 RepID=A0A8T3B2X2_DENNO|nr:hypothetical protein KFK09_014713 [Dendrobium nobile]